MRSVFHVFFSDISPPGRADLPHRDLRHPLPDHGGQVPAAEDTLWRLSSETRLSLTDAQNGKHKNIHISSWSEPPVLPE